MEILVIINRITLFVSPVPASPTGLLVSGKTNSMLTVSWTYDHPDSGENIFGYSIYVDGEIVGTTSNDVMQYNITGLDPFTNYSIQVTAFNDNNGPRSDAVVAMTEEDSEFYLPLAHPYMHY